MSGISKIIRGKAPKREDIDPDLLREALAVGVSEDELDDGGGWRKDNYNRTWWLPVKELAEMLRKDAETEKDDDFWTWFADFRKERHLEEKVGWGSGRTTKVTDWSSHWKGTSFGGGSKKDYLTDWWKGWGYSGFGKSAGSTEQVRKLVVAQGAVSSVISAVNTTGKRYRVEMATDDNRQAPKSATSFEDRTIIVSPQALLDPSCDEAKGIAVTTGYALHEASHVEYTEPLVGILREPDLIEPLSVSSLLFNILEDLRIEKLTSDKFPGFASYLQNSHDYLWDVQKDKAPKKWEDDLSKIIGFLILASKWGPEYGPIAKGSGDQRIAEEFDWWNDWGKRYEAGQSKPRVAVEEGMARLYNMSKTVKKQLDEIKADEQAAGSGRSKQMSDDEFREFMRRLREAMEANGKLKIDVSSCEGTSHPGVTLTQEQADEINKLLREQFKQDKATVEFNFGDKGVAQPTIINVRPEEDEASHRSYKNPDRNLVTRLRSAFFFRKAAPAYSERGLANGLVDDEEVWKVAADDFKVFERRSIQDDPQTQVTMLVDMSGSMWGENLDRATMLATVMLECLKLLKGVRVRVRSHTDADQDSYVARIWEPGDPMTRLGLLQTLRHGCNWDGFAIQWCQQEMLDDRRGDEDMVLIVLSDGLPNGGWAYSGKPAMQHVREVNQHYERLGVKTIQIAIDNGLRPQDQSAMYDHWIGYENDQKLAFDLTKLLIKLFSTEE